MLAAFSQVAAHEPVVPECTNQAKTCLQRACIGALRTREAPAQRGTDIGEFPLQPVVPLDLCRSHHLDFGLLSQGTREWTDYRVTATLTPHLATSAGLAARVGGLRRYYALLLHRDGHARLVKVADGTRILAEQPCPWTFGATYEFSLAVAGPRLSAWLDLSSNLIATSQCSKTEAALRRG